MRDQAPRGRGRGGGGMMRGMRRGRGGGVMMRGNHRFFGNSFGGYGYIHFHKVEDLKLLTKEDFIQRNSKNLSGSSNSAASEQEINALSRDYDAYLQDCRDKFFITHARDGWLLDLYDPIILADLWDRRASIAKERSNALHDAHISGALDELTLNASEYEKNTVELNDENGVNEWCCLKGVTPSVPHKVQPPCPPYNIFISVVPPSWTRKEIVEKLKSLPGCEEIALSQPNRANYVRECRLTFRTKDDATNAHAALMKIEICGASLPAGAVAVLPPEPMYPPPVRVAPAAFSNERVMSQDVENLLKLCAFFDSEMSIPEDNARNTFSSTDSGKEWDSLTLEQKVDRLVIYLRLTHNVCYYCAREFFDEDEMHMMCGRIHLRGSIPNNNENNENNNNENSNINLNEDVTQSPEARMLMNEIEKFVKPRKKVDIPEVIGKHIKDEAINKFCDENTRTVKDTVVACLLCSKKFKGKEYINNHIISKHATELDGVVRKALEGLLKKNYMCDPHRIAPEADSSAVPVPLRPYKDLDSIDDTEAVNIYKSMFVEEEEEEEEVKNEKEVDMGGEKEENNANDENKEGGNNNNNGVDADGDDDMKL